MMRVNEFVVEVDQDSVLRARTNVEARTIVRVCVTLFLGAVSLAAALLMLWPAMFWGAGAGWVPALLALLVVLVCVYAAVDQLRKLRRWRAGWATYGVPPVAMRMSSAGLRVSIDAAPDSIFLPWPCVRGFHREGRRSGELLVLDLMPGVTAATAGVTGLEHPDAQRMLGGKVVSTTGLRTALRVLRPHPFAIDQALAAYTGGRVRIH